MPFLNVVEWDSSGRTIKNCDFSYAVSQWFYSPFCSFDAVIAEWLLIMYSNNTWLCFYLFWNEECANILNVWDNLFGVDAIIIKIKISNAIDKLRVHAFSMLWNFIRANKCLWTTTTKKSRAETIKSRYANSKHSSDDFFVQIKININEQFVAKYLETKARCTTH